MLAAAQRAASGKCGGRRPLPSEPLASRRPSTPLVLPAHCAAHHVMSASQPTAVYSSTSGYTASARRLAGTAPPMKGMEAHDDQTIMMGTTIHLGTKKTGTGEVSGVAEREAEEEQATR